MPALPKTATDLGILIASYCLCAQAEGKRPKTIEMVASCVGYLDDFLNSEGFPTDFSAIGPTEIRAYALYLQHKKSFNYHPYTHIQPRGLSEHTVNCYLRSIRAFWGWLVAERIGLASGDIIIELNMKNIANASDLENALSSLIKGNPLSLVFLRGNKKITAQGIY